jgi:hypothetical protein
MKYLVLLLKACAVVLLVITCSHRKENNLKASDPISVQCGKCQNVVIDGKNADWSGKEVAAINNRATVGLCSDKEYVYFCFTTRDPEISMQIMNFGCSLWFSQNGEFSKTRGLQFPVFQNVPPPPRDAKPPSGKELQAFLDQRLSQLGVLDNKSDEVITLTQKEALSNGIDARISVDNGLLCYELKYPRSVRTAKPIGINATGKTFSVCIETPEIDLQELMKDADRSEQVAPDDRRPPLVKKPVKQTPEDRRNNDAGNQRVRPKPPQFNPVSQWIRVTLND